MNELKELILPWPVLDMATGQIERVNATNATQAAVLLAQSKGVRGGISQDTKQVIVAHRFSAKYTRES